jgi:hypothetical protein
MSEPMKNARLLRNATLFMLPTLTNPSSHHADCCWSRNIRDAACAWSYKTIVFSLVENKQAYVMPICLYGLKNHLRTFSFLKPLSLPYTSDLHTQVNLCQHFCHKVAFHSDLWKCKWTNSKQFIYSFMFCWPRILIIVVVKTNLMHYLPLDA